MKLISVWVMALLLVAGIGSAQNYMPEFTMEPGAGIEMDSTTPGDVELHGGALLNSTMGGSVPWTVIGPYDWCDYVTDGTADEVQWNQAIADGKRNLYGTGLHFLSANASIEINQTDIRLTGSSKGWEYSDQFEIIPALGTTAPAINVSATGCEIFGIYIGGRTNGACAGGDGIKSSVPIRIDNCMIFSVGDNGIWLTGEGTSFGSKPVTNCYIWNCSQWGIKISGNDLILANTEIGSCTSGSILLEGSANQICNCHVWPEPGEEPLQSIFMRGDSNIINGCVIDTFGWVGIYIYGGEYNSIIGCMFTKPMETGANCIKVEKSLGGSHLLAMGNFLRDDGPGSVTNGIVLGDTNNNTIVGNCVGLVTETGGVGNEIAHNNVP